MSSGLTQKVSWFFTRQELNITLPALGILLFTFYIFTQRWFELFIQIRALQVAVVGLAFLILLPGMFERKNITGKLSIIDYSWLPAIVLIILYILFYGNPNYYSDVFIYSAGFFFLILAKVNIESFGATFVFIKYFAAIYALGTIHQYFFTDSFNAFIFNLIDPAVQEHVTRVVLGNYYPGFGFGQAAVTALYIAAGLGMLVASSGEIKKSKTCLVERIILYSLLFIAILMTGKRAIILTTFTAFLFTYYILGFKKEKWKRAIKILVVLIIAITLILLLLQEFNTPQFLLRMEYMIRDLLAGQTPASINQRFTIYKDAWTIFLDNPVFGIGWKQFEVTTSGFYHRDFHVHNVYLQLLVEMGSIGFTLVMIPFIYCYIITYKSLKYVLTKPREINPLWVKGLAFALYFQTYFLIYCLAENPFFNIIYVLFYFLAISIVSSFVIKGYPLGASEKLLKSQLSSKGAL